MHGNANTMLSSYCAAGKRTSLINAVLVSLITTTVTIRIQTLLETTDHTHTYSLKHCNKGT